MLPDRIFEIRSIFIDKSVEIENRWEIGRACDDGINDLPPQLWSHPMTMISIKILEKVFDEWESDPNYVPMIPCLNCGAGMPIRRHVEPGDCHLEYGCLRCGMGHGRAPMMGSWGDLLAVASVRARNVLEEIARRRRS